MLIGVDWGTTRLRAYLIGPGGETLARAASDEGLMKVAPGGFASALVRVVGGWHDDAPAAPILLSGMVGSRQGWVEAPYVPVPATLSAIAAGLVRVDAPGLGQVAIVPGVAAGVSANDALAAAAGRGGWADVIRGEETEVFGALAALQREDATFVLPGTHSKWVTVEGGTIAHFRTYMTGDVFAAVARHTILAKMLGADRGDRASFARGCAAGRELAAPGDLLTRLFSIRAEGLMGRLGDDAAASFLSGLLIGAEVASGAAGVGDVVIVGTSELAERYGAALDAAGVSVTTAPDGAAARGLALIAARAGMV